MQGSRDCWARSVVLASLTMVPAGKCAGEKCFRVSRGCCHCSFYNNLRSCSERSAHDSRNGIPCTILVLTFP